MERVRPALTRLSAERCAVDLFAVDTCPAQMICSRRPFTGLVDLTGRHIRASSLGKPKLMEALDAPPAPANRMARVVVRAMVERATAHRLPAAIA